MGTTAAAERKQRERKYFEMVGTESGSQVQLSSYSQDALEKAATVLGILATAGAVFPRANGLRAELVRFVEEPTGKPAEAPAKP